MLGLRRLGCYGSFNERWIWPKSMLAQGSGAAGGGELGACANSLQGFVGTSDAMESERR
jgi:hypothetical protein